MLSTPRYRPFALFSFLVVSILLHIAVITVLPDLTRLFNIHINRLGLLGGGEIEISLVEPEVRPEPEPKPPLAEKPLSLLAEDHISALVDLHLKELSALGDASLLPPAPIKLPELLSTSKQPTLKSLPLPETVSIVRSQELLGRMGKQSIGRLSGRRLGGSPVEPVSSSKFLIKEFCSYIFVR